MPTREHLHVARLHYRNLLEMSERLLVHIEEAWLGSPGDATWHESSTRAIEAAEDVSRHLQHVLNAIHHTPATND